jgi:CheY-like chemotaxis protein
MSQPLRVLLVEDQADLRELMADAFTGLGMEVATAADADDALSLLRQGMAVDVLFSDVYMPGQMSGAELAMRVCRQFPQVRVILASGHGRQQLPELPVKVEFVQKPYSLAQVTGLLRSYAAA